MSNGEFQRFLARVVAGVAHAKTCLLGYADFESPDLPA